VRLALLQAVLHALADVPTAVILAVVFVFPALEASTLLGVFVPGETAILLGGVLAWYGRVSLPAVIAAAALGAVVGDSIGYGVGRRWGTRIVEGRIGRLVGEERWARARRRLNRKGFLTIVVGRFPPIARTLVPVLAGSAGMPYPRFLAGNALGGVVWATASALVGYVAGDAWQRIERVQQIVAVTALAAVAVAVAVLKLRGRRRERGRRQRLGRARHA
jgi:membrane protein DedA with SNARE-associated domain